MEENGLEGSRDHKAYRARLPKADPLTRKREGFFEQMTKAYSDVAERLLEEGHAERALELLERAAPAAAGRRRGRMAELLERARAIFEEVRLDEAGSDGGETDEDERPLVELEGEHYLLACNLEPEVVDLVADTMDDIFGYYALVYFDGDAKRASRRKATIRVHGSHPRMMEQWSGPPRGVGGWWSPGEWTVHCYDTRTDSGTLDVMLATLFHEASHQFMTMIAGGGSTPSWLNEGTASFFEGATAMADHRVLWPDAAEGRLRSLTAMLRGGSGPTPRQVVAYDEPGSYPGEYYPFGWGLVYFLQQYEDPETLEYVWRPYYVAYRDRVTSKGGSPMEAFEEVFLARGNPGGFEDFDGFAKTWRSWILDTVWPLHLGRDRRALRWSRARRYLAAADELAGGSGKAGPDEQELLLRALRHAEFIRTLDGEEQHDLELLSLRADLLERLGRGGSAAAAIEEILELADSEAIPLEEEHYGELEGRMAMLDRRNDPLKLLRRKTANLRRNARRILAEYERREEPLLLRSLSFAREAGIALDDSDSLLSAAERLRARAREAGLFASRIVRVRGDSWVSILSSGEELFDPAGDSVSIAMPARAAGRICTDVGVEGEYEVRGVLVREGEVYRSSYHAIVVSGRPEADWILVGIGSKGKLVVKRIEVDRGGGSTPRGIVTLTPDPPCGREEELAVRVLPSGRLSVRLGDRPAVDVELDAPLPSRSFVGVYVRDAHLRLEDFQVEIFP